MEKLNEIISDVEKLVVDFENLIEDQDQIAAKRLKDIKEGKVECKTEDELDTHLKWLGT